MEIPDTNSGANRRRSLRRKPRSTLRLQCRKGAYGLGKDLAKQALDLSDCGVRIIVADEMVANSEVELLIESYGIKPIKRLATVRWQVKLEDGTFCVGLEFNKRLEYRDWQQLAAPS